jgi:hypothetical protein
MTNFITYLQDNVLLARAFKYIIDYNKGAYNPYHSTFHLLDVFTTSMEIANTYDTLTEKDRLEIGLAALFHDFNHSGGKYKRDADNITLAIIGLTEFFSWNDMLVKDMGVDEFVVEELINITEFPHQREPETIKQKIIRDSDMIQCYNKNWFLNVITGFQQREIGLTIQEGIQNQIKYLKNIQYYTDHAKYIHNKEKDKMLENLYYIADLYK